MTKSDIGSTFNFKIVCVITFGDTMLHVKGIIMTVFSFRILIYCLVVSSLVSCRKEEDDESVDDKIEKVYVGDIWLQSQAQLDTFGISHYTKIDGNLTITSCTNVEALAGLCEVTGNVSFFEYDEYDDVILNNCTSLKGLDDLIRVGKTYSLLHFGELTSSQDFEKLRSVGTLSSGFLSFDDFSGFKNLEEIEKLRIEGGRNFTELSGFSGITSLHTLYIHSTRNLKGLTGLTNLTKLTSLIIEQNDVLEDLSGLEALNDTIDGVVLFNAKSITSLSGLDNVKKISTGFSIIGCSKLTNYCAISSVDLSESSYNVKTNAYNPSKSEISNSSSCSL